MFECRREFCLLKVQDHFCDNDSKNDGSSVCFNMSDTSCKQTINKIAHSSVSLSAGASRVVSAVHRGSVAVRRHMWPPAVVRETHLFNEVSQRELRDLQTGDTHTLKERDTHTQKHTDALCLSVRRWRRSAGAVNTGSWCRVIRSTCVTPNVPKPEAARDTSAGGRWASSSPRLSAPDHSVIHEAVKCQRKSKHTVRVWQQSW